jgi:uncharacterized protein (TIGR03118 family)
MEKIFIRTLNLGCAIACMLFVITGCQKNIETPAKKITAEATTTTTSTSTEESSAKNPLKDFVQVNLVGDNNDFHPARIDPNLINGWGMAFAPSGPDWISAEGTGLSVIYNTLGNDVRPPVTIPSPGSATGGHPTGVVFNGTTGFKLPNGNPARFIFVGTDGVISGWNGGNAAIRALDRSATSVYTGLALAADGLDTFLYAANFRTRKIDVFNKNWSLVSNKPFKDFNLPSGYAPFNIQNVGGKLFVMYAKVGSNGDEEVGPGNGFVDIYKANGSLVRRLVSRGELNAPWGVAMAPKGFWGPDKHGDEDKSLDAGHNGHNGDGDDDDHGDNDLKNVILVGNFGDGKINAYNEDGHSLGHLRAHDKAIEIEGLWSISFAPTTATTIDPNWLFFAAGPGDEAHGLFGYIKK